MQSFNSRFSTSGYAAAPEFVIVSKVEYRLTIGDYDVLYSDGDAASPSLVVSLNVLFKRCHVHVKLTKQGFNIIWDGRPAMIGRRVYCQSTTLKDS
jgi:hypothetical protein